MQSDLTSRMSFILKTPQDASASWLVGTLWKAYCLGPRHLWERLPQTIAHPGLTHVNCMPNCAAAAQKGTHTHTARLTSQHAACVCRCGPQCSTLHINPLSQALSICKDARTLPGCLLRCTSCKNHVKPAHMHTSSQQAIIQSGSCWCSCCRQRNTQSIKPLQLLRKLLPQLQLSQQL